MLFVELAEFSTFIALFDFYIFGVLVLVFIETCVKLYFSQKITFKNIIECICFPVVMMLLVLIPITKTIGFIKEFILTLIYIRRAQVFISKTQGLSNEELIDCICKNFLKEDSLNIKFYVDDEDIHLE